MVKTTPRSDGAGRRERATDSGGLSKARLGRMHDVMAGHVEAGAVPGLVTLISRRGEVHVDAIGMKAAGGSEPMRRDTLFRIASMTKPGTSPIRKAMVEAGVAPEPNLPSHVPDVLMKRFGSLPLLHQPGENMNGSKPWPFRLFGPDGE
jgi:hypothetical protein